MVRRLNSKRLAGGTTRRQTLGGTCQIWICMGTAASMWSTLRLSSPHWWHMMRAARRSLNCASWTQIATAARRGQDLAMLVPCRNRSSYQEAQKIKTSQVFCGEWNCFKVSTCLSSPQNLDLGSGKIHEDPVFSFLNVPTCPAVSDSIESIS